MRLFGAILHTKREIVPTDYILIFKMCLARHSNSFEELGEPECLWLPWPLTLRCSLFLPVCLSK